LQLSQQTTGTNPSAKLVLRDGLWIQAMNMYLKGMATAATVLFKGFNRKSSFSVPVPIALISTV